MFTDNYENLMNIIRNRRTIREFLPKQVPKEVIEKAIDAARWAPSACNRQLWEFIVVSEQSKIKAIDQVLNQESENGIYVIVCYDFTKSLKSAYYEEIQTASMAAQNFLLAAHTLGLGCKLRGGLGNVKRLKEMLRLPEEIQPVVPILIGYPAEEPTAPIRRRLEDIIHVNEFNGSPLYPATSNIDFWTVEQVKAFQETVSRYGGELHKKWIYKRPKSIENRLAENYAPWHSEIAGRNLFLFPYHGFFIKSIIENASLCESDIVVNVLTKESKRGIERLLPSGVFVDLGDGMSLNYEDYSFDKIWWLDGIGHHPHPKIIIQEIDRILKNNGRFYLSFSNSKSLLGIIYRYWLRNKRLSDTHLWKIGPERRYSLKKIKGFFQDTSLEILNVTSIRLGFPKEKDLGRLKKIAHIGQGLVAKLFPMKADILMTEFEKR